MTGMDARIKSVGGWAPNFLDDLYNAREKLHELSGEDLLTDMIIQPTLRDTLLLPMPKMGCSWIEYARNNNLINNVTTPSKIMGLELPETSVIFCAPVIKTVGKMDIKAFIYTVEIFNISAF